MSHCHAVVSDLSEGTGDEGDYHYMLIIRLMHLRGNIRQPAEEIMSRRVFFFDALKSLELRSAAK